ncbi:protoporphyrinogen oxidase [Alicyclobacillus tolerans]|uniref:Coproporphyrinogen III oxidase n=1 Tax=Alicyclobacillus tolerans TaxID=90970 RepID=A0ABT9LSR2_9BACL|nr:protoporphyrinogen oxidase [Alicyclobacillus tengchongensis]MDP9727293.1 oxygen-dependent protoporphyrinogen oxidase [Alicyclobacillus tengchongensis]
MRRKIAIVGGGITGLTAAYQLLKLADAAKEEIDCHIFEASSRLGGKILTYREQNLVLEAGPDSMLARKPAGVQLIRDLGLESEIIEQNPNARQTYIVKNGQLVHMPGGTQMGIPIHFTPFLETPLLSAAGKTRVFSDLVLPKREDPSDESLGHFLRRRFGDELTDSLCEPLLAGIYAGRVDDLSLQATFPQFADLEKKYRSVILGLRKTAHPTTASTSGRSAFITLRGGLQSLIDRLSEVLSDSAQFHLRTPILEIQRLETGGYELSTAYEHFSFDCVLWTTDTQNLLKAANKLLPVGSNQWLNVPAVSTATILLGYTPDQLNHSLDGSGFVVPRLENRAITAATWTSSKWPHTTQGRFSLIRCYVGRSGQQEILELDDKQILQKVRRDLEDLMGIQASPYFTHITRWQEAMPQYLVGHRERIRTFKQHIATHTPGFLVAGASYDGGVGIPDCVLQGQKTATDAWMYMHTEIFR